MKVIMVLMILGAMIACSMAWSEPESKPKLADSTVIQEKAKPVVEVMVPVVPKGHSYYEMKSGYPYYQYQLRASPYYVLRQPYNDGSWDALRYGDGAYNGKRVYYPGYYSTYTISQ